METKRKPLLIGNWKMNPRTQSEAKELFLAVKKGLRRTPGAAVVCAVPSVFLAPLRAHASPTCMLGAQDVSSEKLGAHTGDISILMLEALGTSHAIIGHSERRASGETDEAVAKKLSLVVRSNVTAVLCVGERERDSSGRYLSFVENQIRSALKGVPPGKLARLAIAYEPIWAISTATPNARAATPEDAHEMILFVRKILTDLFGRAAALRVPILYGGSVDQKNIAGLVAGGGSDGYLVGGASLRAQDFSTIIRTVYAR